MKTAQTILTLLAVSWMNTAAAIPIEFGKDKMIKDLKTQIVQISNQARGKYDGDDNDPAVRAKLDPLVDQLIGLADIRNETAKLPDVVGTWHQLWSDGPSGMKGAGPLADQIFQVVFPNGYFWNVAKEDLAGKPVTAFLRGKWTIAAAGFGIEFDKAVVADKWPVAGADVSALAMRAEVGAFDANPRAFDAAANPLGKKTWLENLYVDEELRISRGGGLDFPGSYLYILERTNQFK